MLDCHRCSSARGAEVGEPAYKAPQGSALHLVAVLQKSKSTEQGLDKYCGFSQSVSRARALLQPPSLSGALPPFLPGRFRVIKAASMMP